MSCACPRTRIAALDAKDAGLGYALDYLGSFGKAGQGAGAASLSATAIAQTTDALLGRRAPSDNNSGGKGESDEGSAPAQVSTVQVTLTAPPQGGELHLTYQVRGSGWQPGYRAELDTRARRIRLTWLALVRQNTGEDWRDVAPTLSTGRPNAAAQGRLPPPWRVDITPPFTAAREGAGQAMAMAAAGAKMADGAAAAPEGANFAVTVDDARYATTFTVPQRVSVRSDGGQTALALDGVTRPVTLLARTAPVQEAAAYLVATLDAPTAKTQPTASAPSTGLLTGVWPPDPVQLYRDGIRSLIII